MAGGFGSLPFKNKRGILMKKGIILVVFLVAVGAMVGFSTFGNKDLNEVVGYIDGEAVQAAELQNYVDTLLGINYAKKMETKEGRQELFNHYVNRKLLLEYAKKNIKEDESFVKSHTMGNVSSESALISAVFKKEINDVNLCVFFVYIQKKK